MPVTNGVAKPANSKVIDYGRTVNGRHPNRPKPAQIAASGATETGESGKKREPVQIGGASRAPEFNGDKVQLTEEKEKKLAMSMYPSSRGMRKFAA